MNKAHILSFSLVDVFAAEPLSGNPLALVWGGDELPLRDMQRIAREFNQSETTFILKAKSPGADWLLRSFTATGTEVFGAGHNALGAWWWLAESRKLRTAERGGVFRQEIGDRVLPVEIEFAAEGGPISVSLTQAAPILGHTCENSTNLAHSLGLSPTDFAANCLPVQVISTGAAHLLVPLKSCDAVDRVRPDAAELLVVLNSVQGQGCYVFSLDARHPKANVYSRFFNPTVGIWEDAGTGSAAGPLAFQLTRYGIIQDNQDLLVEQGTAIGRTSLIRARVTNSIVGVAAHQKTRVFDHAPV